MANGAANNFSSDEISRHGPRTQEFLKTLVGKRAAVSFIDCDGSKPEPINVDIVGIHFEKNQLIVSIPLDKVYSLDTELY